LKTTSPADIGSFFDRDPETLSSSTHAQSDGAAELRGAAGSHDHEGGVGFARETRESHRDAA
jgi:hypothetical protein